MQPHETNEAQAAFWQAAGPVWQQRREQLDAQISEHGLKAIEVLAPQSGETIIDVGCGTGTSSFQLAERVGGGGRVIGCDISSTMCDAARARAAAFGSHKCGVRRGGRTHVHVRAVSRRRVLAVRCDVLRRSEGCVRQHSHRSHDGRTPRVRVLAVADGESVDHQAARGGPEARGDPVRHRPARTEPVRLRRPGVGARGARRCRLRRRGARALRSERSPRARHRHRGAIPHGHQPRDRRASPSATPSSPLACSPMSPTRCGRISPTPASSPARPRGW